MGPKPTASNTGKRKASSHSDLTSRKKRRVGMQDARVIASQTTGKAFKNGELDVDKFVRSREFEIKALEDGMRRAKKTLSSRAFQEVSRDLRRRTASHNAKRVPKRLQARAKREMLEDNTPTVTAKKRKPSSHMRLRLATSERLLKITARAKAAQQKKRKESKMHTEGTSTTDARCPRAKKGILQRPERPKARFRKRQIHKTWLPTHMYHAKRAHMTPPKEPLWRMAIPLSPTMKSYRPTHRASNIRGGIAWDMSYMSTIGLEGPRASIVGLLKALGVGADKKDEWWTRESTQRWLSGSRSWDCWLHERNAWPAKAICPATIVWCKEDGQAEDTKDQDPDRSTKNSKRLCKRQAVVRIHPSAFLQVWEEVKRLSQVQKPAVLIEDLRFEIGSIELMGPGAAEALIGSLWPSPLASDEAGHPEDSPAELWHLLKAVSNPASLPAGAIISFDATDPRLHHPPRPVKAELEPKDQKRLLEVLCSWPLDLTQTPSRLFSPQARWAAGRQLPSQKAINRRKGQEAPGQYPGALPSDPRIPIMALGGNPRTSGIGKWTILLPWKCVLPAWYMLMHQPLSSGGTLRLGGLEQLRQVHFESGTPWFPGDFPGTKAGMAWEENEAQKRKAQWERRPKGKRIEYASIKLAKGKAGEVGAGWACDWEGLVKKTADEESGQRLFDHVLTSEAKKVLSGPTNNGDAMAVEAVPSVNNKNDGQCNTLATIKMTALQKGVSSVCARIYRLPSIDAELRRKWLELADQLGSRSATKKAIPCAVAADATAHVRRQRLAAQLLEPEIQSGMEMPEVPGEEDLIGFVTTGNYNLSEGKGTSIGSILMSRVGEEAAQETLRRRLCIVRESGHALCRLARWELV